VSTPLWIIEPEYFAERDLPIYHEELEEFLPESILDCHCHTYLLEHLARELTPEEKAKSYGVEEKPFSIEDVRECFAALFPGKRCEALVFGTPSAYFSLEAQNAYVADRLGEPGIDGLALLSPTASEAQLDALADAGFVGFKPYDQLVAKPLPEVTIRDMVPEAARRVANRRRLIILLHVPRVGRIADPANIREVCELCDECPDAQVILAHIGRAYGPWYIEQAIGELSRRPNLWYDIAALDDADSMDAVLRHCGPRKLLFGTDLPIAAMRGKHLCVNRQCIFLTRDRFPWSVSSEKPGELKLTFFAYETVRALRRACERNGLSRAEVEAICYDSAREIIDRAKA